MAVLPRLGMRAATWMRSTGNPFPDQIRFARQAEDAGLDAVFFGDRLLASAASGDESIYKATMADVVVSLSAVAASTSRISLGPMVLVLPFRHPVLLAKMLGSLDQLSGGRLILPVGSGWNSMEFEALGVDKRHASAIMLEDIAVMRALWRGGPVYHHGQFYSLSGVAIEPVTVRAEGPPIWMGSFLPMNEKSDTVGRSEKWSRVFERVGRHADAWVPMIYSQYLKRTVRPDVLGRAWSAVKSAAEGAGRSVDFVLSAHVGILESAADVAEVERGLETFFVGGLEAARSTYVIGDPESVVRQLLEVVRAIPECVMVVLTLVQPDDRQYDLLTSKVFPALRDAWASRPLVQS